MHAEDRHYFDSDSMGKNKYQVFSSGFGGARDPYRDDWLKTQGEVICACFETDTALGL
ncbi:MAG: hypothetical protein HZT40_20190 [Candidatus Thiothrix singaporensis]|uniref:Uncharacterized protein n=1 Tax=Candidatus Thiothrix singaporensis TaxID=2799669 RepID=A0A7L6AWK6_9GAMM|nr:MAG: hypothetical protein HZT40_20190 [Candidatus Thiothrix singaporensis]